MTLKIINELKPAKYRYNEIFNTIVTKDDRIHFGFMAQDLLNLFGKDHAIVTKNPQTGYYMVDLTELIAPLTKSIQELSSEVEILKKEINNLKK